MPTKSLKTPAYRHYKPKNLGVVRINGKDTYLGKYDSPESWQKYRQVIADWLAGGFNIAEQQLSSAMTLGVNCLVERYLIHCRSYYERDGNPGKEYREIIYALKPLCALHGLTPISDFVPKALKQVREEMIRLGWARQQINKQIGRIKHCFKWGVAEGFVPPDVLVGLQAVQGLQFRRSKARETEPIRPVADEHVNATLPYLSPVVADMVRIQRLTGMRPCELAIMRPCDIDRTGQVWVYEPYENKNSWRGHRRLVACGPRVQEILQPYLNRPSDSFLFSPGESEERRNANRRQSRKTPLTPSQSARKRKSKPKRTAGERYDTDSYRRGVYYGIAKANKERKKEGSSSPQIPKWFPLQLRHTRATEVRRHYGLDGAQSALGHKNADVTQVYAEKNLELAIKIAQEMG